MKAIKYSPLPEDMRKNAVKEMEGIIKDLEKGESAKKLEDDVIKSFKKSLEDIKQGRVRKVA